MSIDNQKILTPPGMARAASVAELRRCLRAARQERPGLKVGLVPTMGCFHDGHLSLMRAARRDCDFVVVSIFVNPRQFGPGEDLAAYPRSEQRDLKLAQGESVDLVFLPAAAEMYPAGCDTAVAVGHVADGLCGVHRPGHFDGVATVVSKLFNLVAPAVAYFGQKDAQQVAVIRRLIEDLNFDISLKICPTVRDPDGLAMSSRNSYLDEEQRRQAAVLFEALAGAQTAVSRGERSVTALKEIIAATLASRPLVQLEYAEVVDESSLEALPQVRKGALLAVAARVGSARLIDNLVLEL